MSSKKDPSYRPFAKIKLPKKQPAPPVPPKTKPSAPAPGDGPTPELSDEQSFLAAMQGVQPLDNRSERMDPPKREVSALPDDDSLVVAEMERLVRGEGEFTFDETGEDAWGRAPGVSQKIVKNLRRGKYAFRIHIDLHGYTRDEAHEELKAFIAKARRDDRRSVLVITGRGKSSQGGKSVLRESLPRWLSRAPIKPHVLAFCTAQPLDGGPGAFYVLLRRPGKGGLQK